MATHLRRSIVAFVIGLCAAVCVSLAGAVVASAAVPQGGVNLEGLGPDSTPAEADETIALARGLKPKLLRIEVAWALLEPRSAAEVDPRALAYLDRLVSDAHANGMGVIMIVDFTPCWASSAPASLIGKCSPSQPSQANRWPPTNPGDYAAMLAYLAQRYGGKGLAAIEVWNEPDQANEKYFAGPNKAARYAAILKAAYPAVKQASPSVTVLAGSLVGYNGVFLRKLYASGIKGYYDALAIHFYSLTLASIRSFRAVQVANGDSSPLWLDEFGWSNCYPRKRIQEEQACVTTAVQAQNVTNLFRELARTSYIAAMTLYELRDSGPESFGVATLKGARKPAFKALAGVLRSPLGRPSPVTLKLRRRGSNVLASGSGPVGDFMQMEVHAGGLLRFKATFTLDRFNRYSITLPSVLGTQGLQVRVLQPWTGSQAQRGI